MNKKLEEIVQLINDTLYTDSLFEIPEQKLIEALNKDFNNIGRYPTDDECEDLVYNEGVKISNIFKHTAELIDSYF